MTGTINRGVFDLDVKMQEVVFTELGKKLIGDAIAMERAVATLEKCKRWLTEAIDLLATAIPTDNSTAWCARREAFLLEMQGK